MRTGTSPVAVGGAAGCSAHNLGSRLTRRRFSSSEFISETKKTLAGETGARRFSKSVEEFLLLMKTVGAVLPPPA
jgi:hypothetical protein